MKIPALNTPVRIDWLDSVSQPGWHYFRADEKPDFGLRLPMQTRGVLVNMDSTCLSVATTIAPRGPSDSKDGHMDVLSIPRGCILSIRVIP